MDQKIKTAYARLARDYATNIDRQSGANAFYERPAMLNQLPADLSGLHVLDAGCAAGWYTEQCLQRGARVTAVDMTPEMVDAAIKRVGSRANILTLNLTEPLPFHDGTFDLIISSLTLHYLCDWDFTFQEFQRVLKRGGSLLFSVHHPFMDFTHFQRPNYFVKESLSDVWTKPEAGQVEVPFYRRPLAEIVNVTTTYFVLDTLVEPQPIPEFLTTGQNAFYERLRTHPHFLIIKAHKGNEA